MHDTGRTHRLHQNTMQVPSAHINPAGLGFVAARHAEDCSHGAFGAGLPYLWLPVHSSKRHRQSLQLALPAATAFIQQQCMNRMHSCTPGGTALSAADAGARRGRMEGSVATGADMQSPCVLLLDDTGAFACGPSATSRNLLAWVKVIVASTTDRSCMHRVP